MSGLNYHHLRYFWITAREGSVTAASKRMGVSASTVSTQIRSLEAAIGKELFERKGRSLVLTDHGEVVKQYADDIFSLGEELVDAVRGTDGPRHVTRLRIGVSSFLPKMVAYQLLQPLLSASVRPVHLVCTEDAAHRLVAELAVQQLDVVLSDAPVGLAADARLHSLMLGECDVAIMGSRSLQRRYRPGFPDSLDGAPVLLPDRSSSVRRRLEVWFAEADVHPRVVAELGDSALLKAFGAAGVGLFPIPSVVQREVAAQYDVVQVGRLPSVRERFYAVSTPGRLDALPLRAIVDAAHEALDSREAEPDAA